MTKRFATLTLIALMLGVAPTVFAQGSGGGSGGSGGGRSDGVGNTPGSPNTGTQPPASGAIQGTPSQLSPGTTPGTTARPIDNTAQATTALQSQGYSNVQGLVRAGDVYRGRAVRDGRTVMIEMDARTGTVRETRG